MIIMGSVISGGDCPTAGGAGQLFSAASVDFRSATIDGQ
jgi:hypothetical protein